MTSTVLVRFPLPRAAIIGALGILAILVALAAPPVRGWPLAPDDSGVPHLTPLLFFPFAAVPALLARRER